MNVWGVLMLSLLLLGVPGARAQEAGELESWVKLLSAKINLFRVEEGLPALEFDLELCAFAQAWAEHLGQTGRPGHRPDLNVRMEDMGYSKMNENLYSAGGFPTVERTLQAWRQSAGHRRNLLNPQITRMGLGLGRTAAGKTFVVFNGAG
jgi:uncharacterized protein YkwD